jgi:hypothetical protein
MPMEKIILQLTASPAKYRDYVHSTLKMDLEAEIAKAEIEYICNVHRLKSKFESMNHLKGAKNEKPDD